MRDAFSKCMGSAPEDAHDHEEADARCSDARHQNGTCRDVLSELYLWGCFGVQMINQSFNSRVKKFEGEDQSNRKPNRRGPYQAWREHDREYGRSKSQDHLGSEAALAPPRLSNSRRGKTNAVVEWPVLHELTRGTSPSKIPSATSNR
jgi:hypothetical protein